MKFLIITIAIIVGLAGCETQQDIKTNDINEAPPSIQEEKLTKRNIVVTIDEAKAKLLNISYAPVKSEIVEFKLTAPGVVEPAPENIAYVAAPISGRIVAIYAHEGENVRNGQLLLEIESLEYGTLLSELLQAKAELDFQANQLDRKKKLTEKKISSTSELEKVRSEYGKAEANHKAAKSRLMAIGVSDKQIENILNGREADPHLKIYSPISGAIDKHLVDLGKAVNSLETLMSIIDLSRVKVKGYVAPEESDLISPAAKVCIIHKLSDNQICDVPITSINPALDEDNKSIVINILTKTKNNFPKPGLNVRLEISVRTPNPMIKIPVSAISYEGNEPTVFVKIDNNKFEKRFLEIYKTIDKFAIISTGLKDGEQIATTQVFSLKALGRFEQFAE